MNLKHSFSIDVPCPKHNKRPDEPCWNDHCYSYDLLAVCSKREKELERLQRIQEKLNKV